MVENKHLQLILGFTRNLYLKIVVVDGGSPDPDRQTPAFLPTIAPHVTAKALEQNSLVTRINILPPSFKMKAFSIVIMNKDDFFPF